MRVIPCMYNYYDVGHGVLIRIIDCNDVVSPLPQAEGTPGQGFIITQYHYQQWPESDRPPNTSDLLQLIKGLNIVQRNTENKPVTVMCK